MSQIQKIIEQATTTQIITHMWQNSEMYSYEYAVDYLILNNSITIFQVINVIEKKRIELAISAHNLPFYAKNILKLHMFYAPCFCKIM